MLILGIESSCDETAASIVRMVKGQRLEVLSEVISSQVDLHKAYGGVVPELAAREHLHNLPRVVSVAEERAGISIESIDLISYTRGPGLKGCLLMGDRFAKALAITNGKSLQGVNHVEAHLLSPMIDNQELRFPFLGLVVSGGHTELYIVRGLGCYELVARTIDDAAGEAFDKSANLLGMEYPGGAKLALLADSIGSSRYKLPAVMTERPEFSFSGLKTAISLMIKREGEYGDRAELAYSIQEAIVSAIIRKVAFATERYGIKEIAISGGVSANRRLREELANIKGVNLFCARSLLCTDNATMIAFLGGLYEQQGDDNGCSAQFDRLKMEVRARWPIIQLN